MAINFPLGGRDAQDIDVFVQLGEVVSVAGVDVMLRVAVEDEEKEAE